MIRKVTASILFLLMMVISLYVKSQIDAYNMDYYSGKDNGAFVQLESILIFSFVFFVLISSRNKIIFGCLGLVVGVISSIICYLIFGTEILFPVSASLLIMLIFYLIDKISHLIQKEKASR